MLEKLSENHKKWVAIAYNMCKCKDKANDIVQDMYVKMYEVKKDFDDGYIFCVIRSIFIEEIREKKREQKYIGVKVENIDYVFNELEYISLKEDTEFNDLKKECYDQAYKKLEKHEKVIIHFSSTMGLREFARNSELSISLIQKTKRKLKILVWQETKKHEELETLSQKLQRQLE